ncbi:hypothetical protein DPMN_118629 [Dreissena polymorpha]|uniref:Uncharacterized protein n=1 Tax=Dreissena polymorpha TaxID=45954 RepID=A0A9D4JM29_DREPO|nr:hypothetical protein DPMN_118629 [Dreissena polymorpha]
MVHGVESLLKVKHNHTREHTPRGLCTNVICKMDKEGVGRVTPPKPTLIFVQNVVFDEKRLQLVV